MKHKELKEGLADLAHRVEQDHEVQMAKSDLYKAAKYSIKLHELLKNCLLYTSPSPRDLSTSRMPSSA